MIDHFPVAAEKLAMDTQLEAELSELQARCQVHDMRIQQMGMLRKVTLGRDCERTAIWVADWRDADGEVKHTLCCAEHHDLIVRGEMPLLDGAGQDVAVTWRLL